jgi:hypothetical protein
VLIGFLGISNYAKMQTNVGNLKMTVKSDKNEYKLGEVVQLNFELKNEGEKNISVYDVFGVGDGSIKVFISSDGKTFPEYNPGWGQLDVSPAETVIKPFESRFSSASVLWHDKPNALKGESQSVIDEVAKRTLLSDFAFPTSGSYFIKVFYGNIESKPIKITFTEPQGEDLEVWDKIKNNGNMAFFIQMNYFPISANKTEEQAKLQSEVEAIICQHPNSFYTASLRQSLNKFRENEAKRKAMIEKLKADSMPKP